MKVDPSTQTRRLSRLAGSPEAWAAFAIVCLTHVPFVFGERMHILYNFDELSLTFAALDRFLGVPSNVLIWPAAPLQALSIPLFLIDYCIWSGFAVSPESYASYFSEAFREPWRAVMLMRLANVVVASLGAALLVRPFARILESRALGIAAAVSVGTVPAFWIHSHTAFVDGIAFGLMLGAVGALLAADGDLRYTAAAGVLTGLAIVSKVTVLPLMPFVLLLCFTSSARETAKHLAVFAGAAVAAGVVGCPYIWTDPIRLAKTIVGNAARKGTPPGLLQTVTTALYVLPPVFWIGMIVGIATSLRKRRHWIVAGAVLTVAGTLVVVSRGGVVSARYLLPIIPVGAVLTVFAVADLRELLLQRVQSAQVLQYAVLGVFVLCLAGNVALYQRHGPASYELEPRRELFEVAKDVRDLDPTFSIAIPLEVFRCTASNASSSSLLSLAAACGHQEIEADALAKFVGGRGVSEATVRALPRVFDEEEQAFVAEVTVMAYPFDRPGLDVRLWTKPPLAARFGFLTSQGAAEQFVRGEVDAVVLFEQIEGVVPRKAYGRNVYLYVREG